MTPGWSSTPAAATASSASMAPVRLPDREARKGAGAGAATAMAPLFSLSLPAGKSMLLSAIGKREVPIPEHIDIYHLTREMPPSQKTPLQCVMEVDTERAMLEREAERLAHEDGEAPRFGRWTLWRGRSPLTLAHSALPPPPPLPAAECEKLMELYERLEELDADKAEARASRILHGLGFTPAMQRKSLKDFSGGWRMRVALAR